MFTSLRRTARFTKAERRAGGKCLSFFCFDCTDQALACPKISAFTLPQYLYREGRWHRALARISCYHAEITYWLSSMLSSLSSSCEKPNISKSKVQSFFKNSSLRNVKLSVSSERLWDSLNWQKEESQEITDILAFILKNSFWFQSKELFDAKRRLLHSDESEPTRAGAL